MWLQLLVAVCITWYERCCMKNKILFVDTGFVAAIYGGIHVFANDEHQLVGVYALADNSAATKSTATKATFPTGLCALPPSTVLACGRMTPHYIRVHPPIHDTFRGS